MLLVSFSITACLTSFYRATAMLSAVYAIIVCLSVCLSAKFERNHPLRGRQMQVGGLKFVTFAL